LIVDVNVYPSVVANGVMRKYIHEDPKVYIEAVAGVTPPPTGSKLVCPVQFPVFPLRMTVVSLP